MLVFGGGGIFLIWDINIIMVIGIDIFFYILVICFFNCNVIFLLKELEFLVILD